MSTDLGGHLQLYSTRPLIK